MLALLLDYQSKKEQLTSYLFLGVEQPERHSKANITTLGMSDEEDKRKKFGASPYPDSVPHAGHRMWATTLRRCFSATKPFH